MAAVLGPHGPPCCNVSGSNLLALYLSHNLRVENIFFDASYHCTFTNIRNGDGTMIDIFTCAKQLHCCVHNCQAVTDEVESNHLAVHLNLSLILFKHTSSSTLNRGTTDWHKIITDKATNICYNDLLLAPHLTNPHHMKILTKKSRKWAKKLPYHLSPSTITGSSSTRTNMPSRLTNATNWSMPFAPLLISPPLSLMQCMMRSLASTKISRTKFFLPRPNGQLNFAPRSTTWWWT